ncbi:MAG: DUF4392 domain-containing protein [bacterium]|nr:DUF4392 domain-containing protein [bacterium]
MKSSRAEGSRRVADAVARIEEICGRDVGRGIAPLVAAARGGLLAAARSIARHPAPHVAILTGFFIPRGQPPAAETDGPVGSAHLSAALARAGVPVHLVTDELCQGAVTAAARGAGVPPDLPFHALGVEPQDDEIASILTAWSAADPPVSHLIAIERVGPAHDGRCRNMRDDDITRYTAPLEKLFRSENGVTIAIADGGNELGMGSLPRALLAASVQGGERIGCAIGCDHLVVCGVSNWGAVALAAALALLRPDWRAALTAELTVEADRKILAATVDEGPAVDGVTGRRELSVDGLAWPVHAEVLERTLGVVAAE